MMDDHVLDKENNSINYYDDHRIEDDYPEVKKKLTLTDVRYYFGILRNFNKYFATSVPYINNSMNTVEVPQSSISMGI
eukprot:CAMPEP_0116870874 /NCGR_PEP_ID=MMETSP0463-20121206/985_1 /TAXON_ID=181622 /ORGANISM="Strombidinopsis sp, Strain SopsisLIS2011" /LENGTH=77 /DNA_ID=CAMNT_0004508253 /DNA_START=5271 /DNA_END=5504 /DNA_ORIENTATION=+